MLAASDRLPHGGHCPRSSAAPAPRCSSTLSRATGVVEPLKIVVSLLLIAAAGGIVMLIMPQRERAFAGWTRLDGLDAEEARMRGSDALVLPAAAAVAAGAGGALALHMFGQLTTN